MPANAKPPAPGATTPRRWTYAVLIVAFLFVLMPFLFWRATWFGGPMTDQQMHAAFAGKKRPRDVQHALAQLEPRIRGGDPSVKAWYPEIIALAANPVQQVRLTAAWTMGQDNRSPEFHQALLALLKDSDVMVARNAALALVRFGDDSGHSVIAGMLLPDAVYSPAAGKLQQRAKAGDAVNPGATIARIQTATGAADVRTSVPGTLAAWSAADGAAVAPGEIIAHIAPSEEMVWEALRALFLTGTAADLPAVQRYEQAVEGMSFKVREQAQLTAQAIQHRANSPTASPEKAGSENPANQ